jgi:CheY-like chemotaxis protein
MTFTQLIQNEAHSMYTRTLNILIVDDDRIAHKVMPLQIVNAIPSSIIKNFEFAKNGKEALDKCNNGAFDLIFMDYNMPIMKGDEATLLIREGNLNSDHPPSHLGEFYKALPNHVVSLNNLLQINSSINSTWIFIIDIVFYNPPTIIATFFSEKIHFQ